VRLRILSRASDLARLQASMVADAIRQKFPNDDVSLMTRQSAGDLDAVTPLASFADKGAFTADLSDALAAGVADMVVHSWKDLPLESPRATVIAATLERADPRDVLLIRADAADCRPSTLRILSSSPRRAWLLDGALRPLLPWRVEALEFLPVRGNVPTRLKRLLEGQADALVVAKAALDRLLSGHVDFAGADAAVRAALARCRWMVLPLREMPGAPAQGALAIEVAASNDAVIERMQAISHQPTWDAVQRERAFLASHGGGCHEAIAATVLSRPYGAVMSAKAKVAGRDADIWTIERAPSVERTALANVFPRPDERDRAERRELEVAQPAADAALLVARADALPTSWSIPAGQLIWASGSTTWQKLAARGIWVHGCADGLGDGEPPNIDRLAGRAIQWTRLTHADAARPGDLAAYVVTTTFPSDLASRTHFFWTSGAEFRRACEAWPAIRGKHHASGPGRTAEVLREVTGQPAGVWLNYEQWLRDTCL
jgi:hydroxymethylbilane synthase